jgi:hypothetical protein
MILRSLVAFALMASATAALAQSPLTPTQTEAKSPLVRFRQSPAAVGDQVTQTLNVDLGLTTKITQSGQTAHESSNRMRREQERKIEVLEVADGRATKAKATFVVSRRQTPESSKPEELVTQPIEGKSYLMSREGDRVVVTGLDGAAPPEEETRLVAESLENVGKPNPFASLLVNRPMTVGQRVLVPREVVQSLLGFEGPIGSVHRFELTLLRVEPATAERPSPVGVFQATIEVRPNDESPLSITLNGEMFVETETCRLTEVRMVGPVQLSSIERTAGGIFQFSAGGELNLAIRSDYAKQVR